MKPEVYSSIFYSFQFFLFIQYLHFTTEGRYCSNIFHLNNLTSDNFRYLLL